MFWKKKKKDSNDYLKNELLRSRMSDISLRTDEIIQQYFFVAKEDTLTLDEYLKIRELATKELGLIDANSIAILGNAQTGKQICLGIKDYTQTNAQIPSKEEGLVRVQQEYKGMEEAPTNVSLSSHPTLGNSMNNAQECREVERNTSPMGPSKPAGLDIRNENNESMELSFENKKPVEPRPEPSGKENDRDSGFDFLRIMQEIDD